MLSHQTNKIIIGGTLLALLGGCSNSAAIESLVSPDPQLKENLTDNRVAGAKTIVSTKTYTTDNSSPPVKTSENSTAITPETQTKTNSQLETSSKIDLPENFPQDIPIYSAAELRSTQPGLTIDAGEVRLRSPDDISQIAGYYQTELERSGWEIIQPFSSDPDKTTQTAIAIKDDLKISLAIAKTEDDTDLTIAYEPVKENINAARSSTASVSESSSSTETEVRGKRDTSSDDVALPDALPSSDFVNTENNLDSLSSDGNQNRETLEDSVISETAIAKKTESIAASEAGFTDLDEVPQQLRKYVEEVAALGILTPYMGDGNIDLDKFAPNQPVTRGEYASWLIAANNKYYSDSPGNKIYAVNKTEPPAFQDINVNDPDFNAIQGLAEAGLVPSILTEDSSKLLFQPDAPLKREDLILWKVPLDIRKALPKASAEAIEESWGFQDAANIDSGSIRALFADYQNGDRSNIKRIFGYTTLFQPKKPITRAEAAASLWYFGFQGDGITASEVLKLKEN